MTGIGHKAAKNPLDVLHASEWNDDHEVDGNVDFEQHELIQPVMEKLASAPASPVEGQYYYNTVQKKAYYYNGTAWQEFCPVYGADSSKTVSPQASFVLNPTPDTQQVVSPSAIYQVSVA